MDFTHLAAFVLAAAVGIVCQSVLLMRRLDDRRGVGTVFGIALIVNVAILINWRAFGTGLSSIDARVLLSDIILLPMSTFLGVLAGVLPFLIALGLCRRLVALSRKG